MQSALTTGPSQDIVGVKRQKLPSIYDFAGHEEILKKIRLDNQVKIEDSTSTQPSPQIHIPSFMPAARTPSLHSASPLLSPGASPNLNLELLKSMMLLNQSTMVQRYLQVLALKQYAQQHQKAPLLIPSREDSSTSCSSNTSHNSQIPIRVPILLRKPSEISSVSSTDIPKFEEAPLSSSKKSLKASACKNYIALLCTGFARSLLTAKTEGAIVKYMLEMIALKKGRFAELEGKQDEELKDSVLEHIYKDICGKKVKKMNKGRDFKVRNSEELGELLTVREEDSELVKFRKEILKDMMDYFFTSNYYSDWLDNGMITQANKDFFLKNKSEIQKKFKNPMLYKPHFDY